MALKKALSDSLIASLKNTANSPRLCVADTRIPGFIVEVSRLYKRFVVRSKGHYKTLGRWPIVTTQEARIAALAYLRELEKDCLALQCYQTATDYGHITALEPKARLKIDAPRCSNKGNIEQQVPTLASTLREYTAVKRIKPRTALDYKQCLERYWADYLEEPLETLTGDAFLARFREITSPSGANYSIRIIRALFRFHNAAHDDSLPIPTAKALALEGAHTIRPKTRLVLDHQQSAWYQAVVTKAGPTCLDLFRFLACTGLRLGEALSLTWADIDLPNASILVKETKNGIPHSLPLGTRTVAFLEARKGIGKEQDEKVFLINQRNVRKAVAKTLEAGATPWSCHDLRRGFVSLATRLSISERLVKRMVNHSEGDVTGKHYVQLSIDALRSPIQAIEDAFWQQWTEPAPASNPRQISSTTNQEREAP